MTKALSEKKHVVFLKVLSNSAKAKIINSKLIWVFQTRETLTKVAFPHCIDILNQKKN